MTKTQKSSTYGIKFGYKYTTETSQTRNKEPISINCHKDHIEGYDIPEQNRRVSEGKNMWQSCVKAMEEVVEVHIHRPGSCHV